MAKFEVNIFCMLLICHLSQLEEKNQEVYVYQSFLWQNIQTWRALHKAKVALWWKIAVHTLKISIIRILSNWGNQIQEIKIDFVL